MATFKSSLLSAKPIIEETGADRQADDIARTEQNSTAIKGAANLTTVDGLDDLESEGSGASWRAITASTSLKFEKTLEERRAVSIIHFFFALILQIAYSSKIFVNFNHVQEIRRDDNYAVLDPLAKDGEAGDLDMRKSQHRRRLEGQRHRRAGRGNEKDKW